MNVGAINISNNKHNGIQRQHSNRKPKNKNVEVISNISNSAIKPSQNTPRKIQRANHSQPEQLVYGKKQKKADKLARQELKTANQEIARLKAELSKYDAQNLKAEQPTYTGLYQFLKQSKEANSALSIFKKNVQELENGGNEIYKSLYDLTISLDDTQKSLTTYDAQHKKVTEAFQSILTQADAAILETKEAITKADKFTIIPENQLSSISAHQRISVEKLRHNEEIYSKALNKCKNEVKTLVVELQETKDVLDSVKVLNKSNQISFELDIFRAGITELVEASANTVLLSSKADTTQESLESNMIKQDKQYNALIKTYQEMYPRFNEAIQNLNPHKLAVLNNELKKTKELLNQIKDNLNKVDHKNVVLKNPNSWNLQFGGLRTFAEYTRLSPLDKAFTQECVGAKKL